MKTTLDIPDDLLRRMKMQAVQEGRKFKDVAVEIFRRGLSRSETPASRAVSRRVKLPLIECRHPATPAMELTANKVAQVLLKQEVASADEAARR